MKIFFAVFFGVITAQLVMMILYTFFALYTHSNRISVNAPVETPIIRTTHARI